MDSTQQENAKFVAAQLGMGEETVTQDTENAPGKLKSNGNITRQILAMIGHDTLESVYGVYHEGGDIHGNAANAANAANAENGGSAQTQGADYQADSLPHSDGENDGE